ncbi:hypothetical protein LTR05_008087 [Lithohypha guttulata]|uniref:Methylated-DNA--protein-cysteine methyltransferase n=1 Tax=Lithohypha guttulata TaxID=1690604 RepID=A0AAN7STS9_9EURO|nr:hypothetical protein LTR05_008087 [Lithohypha guttulata]
MSSMQDETLENLREDWKTLYATTLPQLARAKDPSQQRWPVTLDHCFARIILDNVIGKGAGSSGEDVQWDKVLSKPAVKNMNGPQLKAAIALGEKIQRGEVDLMELDRMSLQARGKNEGKYKETEDKKKKRPHSEVSGAQTQSPGKRTKLDDGKKQATLEFESLEKVDSKQLPSPAASADDANDDHDEEEKQQHDSTEPRSKLEKSLDVTSQLTPEQIRNTLKRIHEHPSLTPFRRRLYISLLSVPCGKYTIYAALAKHLQSVARAVGNGMRNNPFAPDVPCHRVLASDGTIGGFFGEWGRDGKLTGKQNEKVELLKREGVKFDSRGKVRGPVWSDFWDLADFEKEYGQLS